MTRNRLSALVLLCSFIAAPVRGLSAQSPGAQPESPFRLRADVELTTVEVYALDDKGSPVLNLTREDFRLYEDGKRQEIVSFDVVDGSMALPPSALPIVDGGDMPRGKTVLIVFDEISSDHARKFHASAMEFVRKHMQPQDLFGVAAGGMKIIQNLTDDREAVLAAIAKAPSVHGGWRPFDVKLQAFEQINHSIASIKGRKSVLVMGRPSNLFGGQGVADAYNRALDSARKANVAYYMVDPGAPRGVAALNLDTARNNSESLSLEGDRPVMRASGNYTMASLAAASGGFSITDVNGINAALDTLNRQLSNYYILGYESSNPKHDGAFRKVKVSTRVKRVSLKHPQGYQDRRPIDVSASSKQEQMLLAALAAPGATARLPISFRPVHFFDSSRPAVVVVAAQIRAENMAFRKKGAQMGADVNIMGVAYSENGAIAARFSEIVPVRFAKKDESEFRRQGVSYRSYFRLRPGKYRLKLAASDESNNLGSMEQSVEVPALPRQGLAFSSLVIAAKTAEAPDLVQRLRTQLLDHDDPLVWKRNQIQPSVDNRRPADSAVTILFRIYNLPASVSELDLRATAKLLDQQGKEVALLRSMPLDRAAAHASPTEAVVSLDLSFPKVQPGEYRLIIETTGHGETSGSGAENAAVLETDIEFVKDR